MKSIPTSITVTTPIRSSAACLMTFPVSWQWSNPEHQEPHDHFTVSEIKISESLVINHSTEIDFTLSKHDVYEVYNLSAVILVCFSAVRFCNVSRHMWAVCCRLYALCAGKDLLRIQLIGLDVTIGTQYNLDWGICRLILIIYTTGYSI